MNPFYYRHLFLIGFLFLALFLKPFPLFGQEDSESRKSAQEKPSPLSETNPPASLIKAIQQRNAELDKRAEALDLKEQRLRIMEQEVGEMLKKHTKLREEIEQKEAQRHQTNDRQLGRLAKMYEAMPPEEAASRIEQMNESLALNLLAKIKEKTAAQILIGMSPAKAARLSQKMVKSNGAPPP